MNFVIEFSQVMNITMSKAQSAFYVFTHLRLSSEIGEDYYPHLTNEETRTQKGDITCLECQSLELKAPTSSSVLAPAQAAGSITDTFWGGDQSLFWDS